MHSNYSIEAGVVRDNLNTLYIGCEFDVMANRSYSEAVNQIGRTYEHIEVAATVNLVRVTMAGNPAWHTDVLADEYDRYGHNYRLWKAERRRIRNSFVTRFQHMMTDHDRAQNRYWRPVAPWHFNHAAEDSAEIRRLHWEEFRSMHKLRRHAHPVVRRPEMENSFIERSQLIAVDEYSVLAYLNKSSPDASREYEAHNKDWLDSAGVFRAECGHFTTSDDAQYSDYHDEHACGDCGYFVFSEWLDTFIRDSEAVCLYSNVEDLRRRNNADWVPASYAENEFRLLDGEYVTSDVDTDEYYAFQDYDDDYDDDNRRSDRAYNGRRLLPYHSNAAARKIGKINKPDGNIDIADTLLLGLEMEFIVEDDDTSIHEAGIALKDAINECAKEYLSKGLGALNYCCAEEDGSLLDDDDNRIGFEVITGFGPIDSHRMVIEEFFNDLSPYPELMGIEETSSQAGIHVHISDWKYNSDYSAHSRISPLHRGKLSVFIHSPRNNDLITAVARRGSCTYATRVASKKVSDHQRGWIDCNRYEGISFAHPNTIEFRLFANSTKASEIMACLEFTHAAWRFTKEASIANITTPHFIDWLNRKDNKNSYAALRLHLYRKGFTTLDLTVVPITISQLLAA